ncbi:MAG TPA: isocitrate dehydrogenase kinase/phosphatase-domain containing protein, partial [Thermoanaerobaculia bacterium]|nr:isocitrate dehydrogenase kinase/phosphatase-domain containing protein [Thermoanaerobaculia bacterium]
LLKNFGLTRHGRVVFYDYDELCLVTDCNFRELPSGDEDAGGGGGEAAFYVGENDVFPEEFETFMGLRGEARTAFHERHEELLRPRFWLEIQRRQREGEILDVFPYPETRRLPHPEPASA